MRVEMTLVALGMVGALAGCSGEPPTALEARVAALERNSQMAVADAPSARDVSAGDADRSVTERLDRDLKSLEQRLAAVEDELTAYRELIAELPADPTEAHQLRRNERRERLRTLTADYREKLADVRRAYRENPADPQRQEALRDVVEWYRRERRAIMRGS